MNITTPTTTSTRSSPATNIERIELRQQGLEGVAPPRLTAREARDAMKAAMPDDITPYVDKYFSRTKQILASEGHNPWVRAQVFIRKGPGEVYGIEETLAAIEKYSSLTKNGGRVYGLKEGSTYDSKETLLVIEGRVQDIIELETIYLGILSRATTRFNDGVKNVDLEQVRRTMADVVRAAEGRPVTYFGARHWHYDEDAAIASAAIDGGARGTSTDRGSAVLGQKGSGTIPHALENIYAWLGDKATAVREATLAFDRVIDPTVSRIALIDYNNREIDDSIATARALGSKLFAIRVDTCGENIPQGGCASADCAEATELRRKGVPLPLADDADARFWYGRGVTITGVYALRKALDAVGFPAVQIMLTSGFGNPDKVKAFVRAEKVLGTKLFDGLGVGGVYSPCRMATMDIVAVGNDAQSLTPIHKVGRPYRENSRLQQLL